MSTMTNPSVKKTSIDDVRLGVNVAAGIALLAGVGALVSTLSGNFAPWLTPAPYLWIGSGCLLAFLGGLLFLPGAGVTSFDTTKSLCLTTSSVLLLLGVFILARSSQSALLLEEALHANQKARDYADQVVAELKASQDESARKLADLNHQLESVKAGSPEALKLKAEVDELKKQMSGQAEQFKTWTATADLLKTKGDAIQRTGDPDAGQEKGGRRRRAASSNDADDDDSGTNNATNKNENKGTPGTPGKGDENQGSGTQKNDEGTSGDKDNDKDGGKSETKESGSSAEQFLSKLIGLGLMAAMPELLPLFKLIGLDLFSMGVREEDLPKIIEAVKQVKVSGPTVNVQEIMDLLKDTKNPNTAAKALEKILSQKGIREQIGDKTLAEMNKLIKKMIEKKPVRDTVRDPVVPPTTNRKKFQRA